MAAKSQPASVWPARISTPPSTACNGKIWPGCTKSLALAFLATAACTVRARSAADIPVVTPSAASIDTVNAVKYLPPLRVTMGGNSSRSQRSRLKVRQIRPRPKRAMKLIASAVTWSAAKTRSPSFSRSSSSIKITILPACMSAMMSSTGEIETLVETVIFVCFQKTTCALHSARRCQFQGSRCCPPASCQGRCFQSCGE